MADEAEAQAAPLDHEMVADNALLGQTLQAREQGMGPAEVRVGGEHRRHPARLRGHADGLPRPSGPRSNSWLPKVVAS